VRLEVYKSLWGMSGSLDSDLTQIQEAGYDGFEYDLSYAEAATDFTMVRGRYNLRYFTLIRTVGPDHLTSFAQLLERAVRLGADFVTSGSGVDSMTFDEKAHFFEGALKVEARFEVPVAHETHRQTALFTPWDTAAIVALFPEMKLTADYSHWCCVCESMLTDQVSNVSTCNSHAVHIHGRVGFPGGPQVNDPRAPENEQHLRCHEEWWREIIRMRGAAGAESFSFDPEFGPPPEYMPALPYTGQPVCNLWDVCLWMANRFRSLFASAMTGAPEGGTDRDPVHG